MTKVLIVSNKSDITSDFIVKRLRERSIEFYRFNTDEFTKSISITINIRNELYIIYDSKTKERIDLKEFTAVYFRRPELPDINCDELLKGEEYFLKSELIYTLEGIYKILRKAYWVSPIYAIREAENKIFQLETAKSLGFQIPHSIISNSFDDIDEFYKRYNDIIIKPIKTGLIKDANGSKIILTSVLKEKKITKDQIEFCPNFLQSHIKKKGDIRVTIVGDKIFATLIHSQENLDTSIDWRSHDHVLKHSRIELPSDLQKKCIKLLQSLNLRFGALDFILDKNEEFIFLEINPNGQWAWIENQTGYEISNEIVNLLQYESFK